MSSSFLPAEVDLVAFSNADFVWLLTMQDSTGAAVNLTGYGFHAQVRSSAGSSGSPILDLPVQTNSAITGLYIVNASLGQVQLQILHGDWPTFTYPGAIQSLAWEFQATPPSGGPRTLARGQFILQPGLVA